MSGTKQGGPCAVMQEAAAGRVKDQPHPDWKCPECRHIIDLFGQERCKKTLPHRRIIWTKITKDGTPAWCPGYEEREEASHDQDG